MYLMLSKWRFQTVCTLSLTVLQHYGANKSNIFGPLTLPQKFCINSWTGGIILKSICSFYLLHVFSLFSWHCPGWWISFKWQMYYHHLLWCFWEVAGVRCPRAGCVPRVSEVLGSLLDTFLSAWLNWCLMDPNKKSKQGNV